MRFIRLLRESCNQQLCLFSNWFKHNNLLINVNKTKTIRLTSSTINLKENLLVRLDGKTIEQTHSAKLLDVTLHQTITSPQMG